MKVGVSYTIFGPPGTGKTTYLVEQLKGAVAKHGGERILVSSFTKTAAVKISAVAVGRAKLEIPHGNIGTLHSLCYRRLGMPPIAEVGALAKEWSNSHAQFPNEAIQPDSSKRDLDDPWGGSTNSDEGKPGDQLSRINVLRARRVPYAAWSKSLKEFWIRWQAFKEANGALDFTDMIERCLEPARGSPEGGNGAAHSGVDGATCGGNGNGGHGPRVIFVDEYQDCSPLEVELISGWSRADSVERVLLSGDDDQMIFGFRGATPDHMLVPLPEDQKRHLKRSYRLPRAIHAYAQKWIAKISKREPKPFEPRDSDGKITYEPDVHYRQPEIVADIAEGHARAGRTCMILGACAFEVDPVIAVMRERGIPFWNPFRRKNGRWNPMRGLWDRAKAFLAPQRNLRRSGESTLWTWSELDAWLDWVPADGSGLERGQKAHVSRQAENEFLKDIPISREEWIALWQDDSPVRGEDPRLLDEAWLKRVAATGEKSKKNVEKLSHAFGVVRRFGLNALEEDPRILVGSIHSVKGEEADVVILFPDISDAAIEESKVAGMDSLRRVFYVGMTRAREELVICRPYNRRKCVEL